MALDQQALDTLFFNARTHNAWRPEPVSDALLQQIYEAARWAPTLGNSQPLRVVFVKSAEAKARLKPHLAPGNVDKTMAAPATAIVAHDLAFPAQMGTLAPHMKDYFASMPAEATTPIATQGSALQGAYLIMAARALGLDCGPMGGFNREGVDAEFLAGTGWKSHFLINLGHGDPAGLYPRAPRLDFAFAARIV